MSKSGFKDKDKSAARDMRFMRDDDNDFAVDPTHKEYRKIAQGHNKVSKRRRHA